MLARILRQAGLELGPESEMMPAQADNPDGFWEHLRFVAINDEILNELGGAWDLPPAALEDFNDPRLDPIRVKARLLIESFASSAIWGWKDPRNSLTVPFWQDLLGELKVVAMVRNPLEVAYSMRKRNGTSYAFGLRLWEVYNRRLLATTKPDARLITNYDAFFQDPKSELSRIAAFVGLPSGGIASAASLVIAGRRHTSFNLEQLTDAHVSPEIIELYRDLIRESAPSKSGKNGPRSDAGEAVAGPGQDSLQLLPGSANRLVPSVPDGEKVRAELASLRGAKLQHERLREEVTHREAIAQREGRIEELKAALAVRDGEIREATAKLERFEILREHLAEQNSEVTVLRERITENAKEAEGLRERALRLEFDNETLRQHLVRQDSEIEQLRDRFIQTNQLLQTRSISLSEHEHRVVDLIGRLRQQLHATRRLSRLLDDAAAAAARLRSSRRWKLSNPFGALKAFFGGKEAAGYGHLEKIVVAYTKWKKAHPEGSRIDEALQELTPRAILPSPASFAPPFAPSSEPPPIAAIEFPIHEEVETSIVVPVFNQFAFTQACLASIQKYAGPEKFEVIVVDDGSDDATPKHLPKIPGLVYVRNENNAGFIASCNRGAAQARGRFLVFLNNDTEVRDGWLTALRETFVREPQAGLVGSKLIFPDGRLQEAGGIIWRDGSGWNRGKFDDPGKPEYNYLREVDYCSGASIMVPRALFEEVGGFDPKFAPAYYEDVDLAFKLHRSGYKILYQPLSQIIHFEGGTGGTDITTGAKQYQAVNRNAFIESWGDVLAKKPENGDISTWERLSPGQQHILVIDHHLPMPDRDAGSLRMFNILDILQNLGHRVTFLPDNLADIPPYGSELQKRGVEVVFHPYLKSICDFLEERGSAFDTVILSRCDFARKHIANVRLHAPQARIIFDTVDLHFLRQQREADLRDDPILREKAGERKEAEFALIDEADETWVVSGFEEKLLQEDRPEKAIEIVSMIVETPGSATPFSQRQDFLFIGGFQHTPNIDAVLYFVDEVHPLVLKRLPEARFYIIGDKAPPAVIALSSENIIVTGLVPDVRPYFDKVKLSIAPLRYGAGIKGKINQSMGLGVPVVATSLAVEGMSLADRREVMIADEANAFADALVELYQSEELWTRISERGLAMTKAAFSENAAKNRLAELFRQHRAKPTRSNQGAKSNRTTVPTGADAVASGSH